MTYTPSTDFVALWRNTGSAVAKAEMPGLDFVVAALARAGLINVTVSGVAPGANQATTAWLKPAVPSSSGESALFLWDPVTTAYAAATPKLLLYMLEAAAGQNGVSWRTSTGGPPANIVGNDGDFAIRTDQPGGIYGPKVSGAWPANPLPGTTTAFISADLDHAFGSALGMMLVRGDVTWEALPPGTFMQVLTALGDGPGWDDLTAIMDFVFGNSLGLMLVRGNAGWQALAPGAAGQVLTALGDGPGWAPLIPAGTVMLFQQTTAPTGWTKITAFNDAGLRVVSGAAGSGGAAAFSTVFAQTATGGHAISIAEMPAHHHPTNLDGIGPIVPGPSSGGITAAGVAQQTINAAGFSMSDTGGGGAHTHPITLNLAYVDVIMASKN